MPFHHFNEFRVVQDSARNKKDDKIDRLEKGELHEKDMEDIELMRKQLKARYPKNRLCVRSICACFLGLCAVVILLILAGMYGVKKTFTIDPAAWPKAVFPEEYRFPSMVETAPPVVESVGPKEEIRVPLNAVEGVSGKDEKKEKDGMKEKEKEKQVKTTYSLWWI